MSQNNIIIELKALTKRYGYGDTESYALKDFDFTIRRGEFIMIMGPSGCGKTTLLNIIGLLDRATSGKYYLNGESVANISTARQAKLRARKIGFIFQNFNLIDNLPAIENVALPLVYAGYPKTMRLKTASSILERFNLKQREYYLPHQLSGGQQQHVAIARAIVGSPEIILADEPTGNLDSRASHNIMEILKSIHEEGNTIIMVTHNPSLTSYATRVIHMLDGQIDTDVKTVADWDLPQPIAVKIKKRKVIETIQPTLTPLEQSSNQSSNQLSDPSDHNPSDHNSSDHGSSDHDTPDHSSSAHDTPDHNSSESSKKSSQKSKSHKSGKSKKSSKSKKSTKSKETS